MSSLLAPAVGMQILANEASGLVTGGMTATRERIAQMHRAWQVVLIVAVAVVLVAGIVSYAVIAALCVQKGYQRVAWSGPNGWKVWQYKIICENPI